MNIIRVTKTTANRIDAVFTGDKYLFLNPDFGLVGVAERIEVNFDHTLTKFSVERSMQIEPRMIEKVISDNENKFLNFKKIRFEYKNLENMQQHTLPYMPNVVLSKVY